MLVVHSLKPFLPVNTLFTAFIVYRRECELGKLEGSVVVVTGAGRGLGRYIAEELGREGATVVVNYCLLCTSPSPRDS